jgi:phosphate transport system substrate-binding protein
MVVQIAKQAGGDYFSPLDSQNVISGKYPISRPLNQYVNGNPEGAVKEFLQFELGVQGQRIVEEMGFFPIPEEYKQFNAQAGL